MNFIHIFAPISFRSDDFLLLIVHREVRVRASHNILQNVCPCLADFCRPQVGILFIAPSTILDVTRIPGETKLAGLDYRFRAAIYELVLICAHG